MIYISEIDIFILFILMFVNGLIVGWSIGGRENK